MSVWWAGVREEFIFNFIQDNRYRYIVNGLKVTLTVTVFALLIGLVIGTIVAMIRSTYDGNKNSFHSVFLEKVLGILNAICKFYLTVIRGTPVVVQLLIGYFIVFVFSTNTVFVASLVFGINSGAYIAEIIRAGINSVDIGQTEASRSLGMSYFQSMRYIIIPQAIKNVLPSLCNEFIALLKETAVCGYIGLMDLTKGGDVIRGRTFSAFMPLIAVALIYLIMVIVISFLIRRLELKLNASSTR